ncbi:hypothetical protein AAC387_Pa04g0523 [Persea americana]
MGLEFIEELLVTSPIKTNVKASPEALDEGCHTPTSEEHKIKPLLVCPPAPRRKRPTKRRLEPPSQGFFTSVPRDLTSIFIAFGPTVPTKKLKIG